MDKKNINDKGLHPRNVHCESYNFDKLITCSPELVRHVIKGNAGQKTIDFHKPKAVLALNKALLICFYNIKMWELPKGSLCPPVPGRADYLHHMADLLAESNANNIPTGSNVKVLDIGVGANCIYPIIGNAVYGWKFVGSDSNSQSLNSAKTIVKENKTLTKSVKLRFQKNSKDIFNNIINQDEKFDCSISNPPFHASIEEAMKETEKKNINLKPNSSNTKKQNFGGKNAELWTPGGELAFIQSMITQSNEKKNNCFWFSTIISKIENVKKIIKTLEYNKAEEIRVIETQHGHKRGRIIAWTYLTKDQQENWVKTRWSEK